MFTVRKILRRNTTFRPFSVSDENELIGVLRTKPRHVLKTVRQLVWRSRKKELKFRNTITFIMLTLQERLRQSEMEPAIASDIIENVLQECIRLDQHDLAHLLFRALLRFQKFGCVISNACMRHLFHSYRKTKNKELLGSFANDLQGRPELRALYVVTLLYAGKTREAEEAQSLIKLDELRTEDYIALVKAFSDLGHEQPVEELRNLLILEEASCQLDKSAVLKVFISCYSSNKEKLWTLLDFIKANKIPVRSDACTLLLRSLLKTANTMTEINEIETQLSSLGFLFDLTASSILVSSYARVRNAEDVESEGLMINKVDTLAHSIEMRIKEGDPHLDISTSHLRAVIRGYGVAGKADSIVETWERLFVKGVSDDIRVLNEVLKWLALVGNVRLIFHMKSKMDEMHIEKNSYTYTWLIKGLGKFYPNHVKKIYDEIKSNNIQKDIQLFNCLILVLSDIQDSSRLEQLLDSLAECERLNIVRKNVWTYTALLKAFCGDVSKCEKIYQEAVEAITEQVTFVHNAFLFVLSKHKKDTEMQQVFQCISAPTTETYNIMLNFYGKQHMVDKVDTLIHDMSIKNVEFNDVTYSTLISLYGKWKDNTRLTALLEDMKVNPPRITASFYSVLASTCRRVGDNEGVDGAWEDLVSSRLFPGAHVYNHFLTLYGRQNDLPRMQVVLDNMMKNIPPNPVTTTTIIDMLGKAGKFKDMEDVLNEMKQNPDTQPNAVTYHQVMNAYAKVGDVVKMENTRAEMILKGYEENAVTFNILAEGYGRAKRFEQLSELNELRRKRSIPLDEIGLCVVLGAYGRAKMLEEVCNMVDEISPELCSKRVIWVILDAFCRCREGEKLLQWVEHLKSKNMTEDDEIALLTYYGRAGFLNKIQEFSDKYAKSERPLPAKALSPMAVSYAKAQNFEKTVEILHIMRDQSAIPDASVCITLSTYFMKAGLHEQAQQIIQWRRQYAANNNKTLVSTMT